jgi:daunorubicin resistance ABC transporter ATP-binding subunit
VIEVDGLVKAFRGGVRAIDGLSLRVPPGVIYGLLGPNGAGKTTLIRVLATLLPFESGVARVAGVDVRRDPGRVRSRIGLAGQYAAVDGYLTGRENVAMVGLLYGLSRREAGRRATAVLERIGLAEAGDRLVRTYSGGMRRRLDLAATLVGEPAVVFLDEPTTGVDPASRLEVWAMVRNLVAAGTTVVLTTQYLDEADRLADRIAVINHGRLVVEGTATQLKDQAGGAVVEVGVTDADRERARAALAGMGAKLADHPADGLTVPAPHGPRSLREVLERLGAAGVVAETAGLRRPTLNEVFLRVTTAGSPAGTDLAAA